MVSTSHVCHQRASASAVLRPDGARFDVSSLVRTANNYKTIEHNADGTETSYILNVCSTLVRKSGTFIELVGWG